MDKCKSILNYFPDNIKNIFKFLSNDDWNSLNEINFITGQPVTVQINAKRYFVGLNGININAENSFKIQNSDIKRMFELITRSSIYAFNRFINDGFLTLAGGHRVGIIGSCVVDNNKIIAINSINSLCFRVAHDLDGNAALIYDDIYKNGKISDTIIISPPGCGKTTFLRNLSSQLARIQKDNKLPKCVIIDERYEIASCVDGEATMNIGVSSSVISGCSKHLAIPLVVRSMAPDVILTDELATQDDINAIKYAQSSGCSVIATTHGYDEKNNKLTHFYTDKIFQNTIILSSARGPGTIEKIIYGDVNDI